MNKQCQDLLLDLWAGINTMPPNIKANKIWVDKYINELQSANDEDQSVFNIVQTLKSYNSNNLKPTAFVNKIRRQLKRVAWAEYCFPQSDLFERIVTLTSKKRMDILVGKDAMVITSVGPVFKALNKKLNTLENKKSISLVESAIETLKLVERDLDLQRGVTYTEIGEYLFNLRWNNLPTEGVVTREVNVILTSIMEKRRAK